MAYPLAVWTQTSAWPPPGSHERDVLDRLYWGDAHLRDEACPEGAYRPPFIYNGSGSGYLFGYKEDKSLARAQQFASAWRCFRGRGVSNLRGRRERGYLGEEDLPEGTILWQIKARTSYQSLVDALRADPAIQRRLLAAVSRGVADDP